MRHHTTTAAGLLLVVAAIATAGCGPSDPYANNKPDKPTADTKTETNPAVAEDGEVKPPPADGEVAGKVPTDLASEDPASFPDAKPTPQATARTAAGLYGNWTSETAPGRFRRIAGLSIGQARAQLRQTAAQSGVDAQQQGVSSRSRIVSLDVAGTGARRKATIVTRDLVTGPGLGDVGSQTNVTLAVLEARNGEWVIAEWEPQP